MRDQNIGRRPLELEALLQASVRSFVLVEGQVPDRAIAKILMFICRLIHKPLFQ